jgi:cytochrome b subunit of formate dehydrogenase
MSAFIIISFLCFICFVLRLFFILKYRTILINNKKNVKIREAIFNLFNTKNSSDESYLSLAKRLNSLLIIGVILLVIAGIVFFTVVYRFPR